MSKQDKLLDKLRNSSNTFEWSDTITLLSRLGYVQTEMAGSRVRFTHESLSMILIHKPHPQNYIKDGALKAVKASLRKDDIL
jgi:predicted RNA binding protein YcfA (HicA-like mRNA interferase family)